MRNGTAPIAITMGDPAGIGPEIVAKSVLERRDTDNLIVVGDPKVIDNAFKRLGAPIRLHVVHVITSPLNFPDAIIVLESSRMASLPAYGRVDAACGRAAYDAVVKSIELAKAGVVVGMVTAPIHKQALSAAGLKYPGHTEILAALGGADRVAMMLVNDHIRTVLVTIHCSLRQAIEGADFAAQMSAIRLAADGCGALGISDPRVAVAGLNPHAGEGGLFGDEEIRIIGPAIEAARAEGIDASGPWPGDTVFMQARAGAFDVVVAQYHDQGLIPVKYLGLEKGVNITLGLPFIRTSPDHGTAFDIAGKDIADAASLQTAIGYAARLAKAKAR